MPGVANTQTHPSVAVTDMGVNRSKPVMAGMTSGFLGPYLARRQINFVVQNCHLCRAAYLATGDDGRFMNAVALRVTPPRSRTSKTMAADQKKGPPAPEPERGTRSALQKLADRFR